MSEARIVCLWKRSRQPHFGIYLADDVPTGIYVASIQPNSPASDAQICPGDRILVVNGQSVSSLGQNAKFLIEKFAANVRSLTLTIRPYRFREFFKNFNGKQSSNFNEQHVPKKTIRFDQQTQTEIPTRSVPKMGKKAMKNQQRILREIRLKRTNSYDEFGLEVEFKENQYVVCGLQPNSPADRAGLCLNDVIVCVGDVSMKTIKHLQFFALFNWKNQLDLIVEREKFRRT